MWPATGSRRCATSAPPAASRRARKTSSTSPTSPALAATALERLARLIATFDDKDTPYRALRRPAFTYDYDDYAHLARVAEWSGSPEEETA